MKLPILITCALPDELAPFVRKLSSLQIFDKSGHFFAGELGRKRNHVAVLHTGMGVKQSAQSLDQALERLRPEYIIISGTAGGVNTEVRMGDLILASNHGDNALQQIFLQKLRCALGGKINLWHRPLHTIDHVLDQPETKRQIAHKTGAFAVDMESRALVAVAEKKGIRVVVLRVISDGVEDRMPLPFERFMRDDGFMSMRMLISHLLLRPWRIPSLVRFGGKVRNACDILAGALAESVTREDLSQDCGRG